MLKSKVVKLVLIFKSQIFVLNGVVPYYDENI